MSIISVEDVRAEGLTEAEAPDDLIEAAIPVVDAFVYIATRQTFEPITYTSSAPLMIDGSGTPILHLPTPVIRLTSLSEYGNDVPLDNVVVYNRVFPDDRFNPKLAKKAVSTLGFGGVGVYYGGVSVMKAPIWSRGYQNVALVGKFGFVEADGASPPPPVKKAALRLLLRGWRKLCDVMEKCDRATGVPSSESTDGHSYSLAGVIFGAGISGDPAIDDVFAMYRRRGGFTTAGVGW